MSIFKSNLATSLTRLPARRSCALVLALGLACTNEPAENTSSNAADSTAGDDAGDTDPGSVTLTTGVTMATANDDSDGSTSLSEDDTTGDATTHTTRDGTTQGDGSDESDTGDTVEEVTIYEIRDGTIPSGTDVVVRGVLVTGIGTNGFFAQEPDGGPFSGVWVFAGNNGPDISGLLPGDEVDFVGFTGVHFGLTQVAIYNGSVDVVSTPNPAPAPETVAMAALGDPAQAEAWESVLVRVEDEVLTVTAINQFDEVTVQDAEGASVMIDKILFNVPDNLDDLAVGATFTAVQGPLNYSFNNFKIAPRSESDLEGYAAVDSE